MQPMHSVNIGVYKAFTGAELRHYPWHMSFPAFSLAFKNVDLFFPGDSFAEAKILER